MLDAHTSAPIPQMSFSGNEEDALFLNDGHGHFDDTCYQTRLDNRGDGRSSAFADLDGDGDLDLVLRQLQSPKLQVFRNDLALGRHWLRVSLEGVQSNRMGIGALVRVRTGSSCQVRPIRAGHGFLSQGPAEAHFGLSGAATVDELVVEWPSGQTSHFTHVAADHVLRVREGAEAPTVVDLPALALGPKVLPALTLSALAALRTPGAAGDALAPERTAGKPTLINLWSPGCKPCAVEAPRLVAHLKACGAQANFLALSAEDTPGTNAAAAKKLGLDLPLVTATAAQLKLLDHVLDGIVLPTTLVFDGEGKLTAGLIGATSAEALERVLPCPAPAQP